MLLHHALFSLLVLSLSTLVFVFDRQFPGTPWVGVFYSLIVFMVAIAPSAIYAVTVFAMASLLLIAGGIFFDPEFMTPVRLESRFSALIPLAIVSFMIFRFKIDRQKLQEAPVISNSNDDLVIVFGQNEGSFYRNHNFESFQKKMGIAGYLDILPRNALAHVAKCLEMAIEGKSGSSFNMPGCNPHSSICGHEDVTIKDQTLYWRWTVSSEGRQVIFRGTETSQLPDATSATDRPVDVKDVPESDIPAVQASATHSHQPASVNGNSQNNLEERTQELEREIAEHLAARKSLAQSEKRFRDFAESASDWFWEMDSELKFSFLSDKFFAITNLQPDQVLGKTRDQVASISTHSGDWSAHLEDLKNRVPFQNFEYGFEAQDGSVRWFRVSGKPILDDDQEFLGYRGTGCDITNRKKNEERVRVLSKAVDQSPSQIIITDLEGNIDYVNPAVETFSGYSSAELIGQNPRILQSGNTPPETYQDMWETILKGRVWQGELSNKAKSGALYWSFCTISPVKSLDGKITHFLASEEDMTLRKQDADSREELERELQQAQKLEAVGQLAGGIAHEINTPIQYIGDNLRFLEETNDDIARLIDACLEMSSKAQEAGHLSDETQAVNAICEDIDLEFLRDETTNALKQSLEGTTHVASIVRAMKEFSHPGSKEKSAVDLNHALESTATVCRNEWKYVAEMDFDLEPELPAVMCMAAELNQVFLNLITNAAHAVGDKGESEMGKISISTRSAGDSVEVRIADSGVGISGENHDKVFDQFFTTKEVGKGTGQGLSLSQDIIVRKHNGSIRFESEPGAGTTFIVTIPVNDQSSDERAA